MSNRPRVRDIPKEGTRIRRVYDLLMENPGNPVTIGQDTYRGQVLAQLQNFYGLDIRLLRHGSAKRGQGLYCLVGYWDGPKYIDFIANKVEEQK